MRLRRFLLFAALAGVAGLVLLERPGTQGTVAALPTAAAPQSRSADSLDLPERRTLGRARGELFAAPPPAPQPKAAAPAPAAAPVAPPVPYRFAGKILRGSEEEVLVSKGNLVFPIKVGDTLDGQYRVESIGADRIELVYLPLGTRDRISISSLLDAPPPATTASAPAPVAAAAAGRPAQLRWEGPESVQAGASFRVALRVTTQEPLQAVPMQLRFEPGVLEPVDVRPGKFFGDGNFSYRVNPAGSIFVGATSQPAAPGADAELVVLTFRPVKAGATAELSMSALSLMGRAGRAIPHEQPIAFRTAIQ